jgi:hypothetical protein
LICNFGGEGELIRGLAKNFPYLSNIISTWHETEILLYNLLTNTEVYYTIIFAGHKRQYLLPYGFHSSSVAVM